MFQRQESSATFRKRLTFVEHHRPSRSPSPIDGLTSIPTASGNLGLASSESPHQAISEACYQNQQRIMFDGDGWTRLPRGRAGITKISMVPERTGSAHKELSILRLFRLSAFSRQLLIRRRDSRRRVTEKPFSIAINHRLNVDSNKRQKTSPPTSFPPPSSPRLQGPHQTENLSSTSITNPSPPPSSPPSLPSPQNSAILRQRDENCTMILGIASLRCLTIRFSESDQEAFFPREQPSPLKH